MYSSRSCACLLLFAPPRGQKTDFFGMLQIYDVVKTHTALVCRTRSDPKYVYEASMYAPLKIMLSGMLHFEARTFCDNYLSQIQRFNVSQWTEHDEPNFSPSFNNQQSLFECHKIHLSYFGRGVASPLAPFRAVSPQRHLQSWNNKEFYNASKWDFFSQFNRNVHLRDLNILYVGFIYSTQLPVEPIRLLYFKF